MLRKSVALLVALVAVLAIPLAADGASKKTVKFTNLTVKVRLIETIGENAVYAGTIAPGPLGPGSTVVRTTGANPDGSVNVRGTAFFAKGTLQIKFSDTVTVQPDGSATFDATDGRITGGTGAYKGASGKFTFKGTAPNPDATQTHKLNGKFSY
ncbi:MAG TPA: hypothetical protein VF549_11235 [Solirubrobacteraceae bacterium]|jgi:hypothetical protein